MRVLIYGINFAPEPVGAGRYTTEMVRWLVEAGHDVRVVTALPYYPEWKVNADYSPWRYVTEQVDGIPVFRSPLWVPHKPGGLARSLHLLTFAVSSLPQLLRQIFWKPDVVWMVAPAFACAPAAWLTARLSGAKAWLHIQDYEIDIAFRMGLLRNRWLQRGLLGLERLVLKGFDRVSSISSAMTAKAVAKGVPKARTFNLPNWVNLSDFDDLLPSKHAYRQELGIPEDAVVALYSGSMGPKHGVDLLGEVAELLWDHPDIYFVFCGEGEGKEDLSSLCGEHRRVRILPLQPAERLSELLAMADIHLLPQKSSAADLVMPSKLTGMLASGRPVVATAEPGTELAKVVQHCGLVVPPGNAAQMADALAQLAADPNWRSRLGQRGREYAEGELSHEVILARFERELIAFTGGAPVVAEVEPQAD